IERHHACRTLRASASVTGALDFSWTVTKKLALFQRVAMAPARKRENRCQDRPRRIFVRKHQKTSTISMNWGCVACHPKFDRVLMRVLHIIPGDDTLADAMNSVKNPPT